MPPALPRYSSFLKQEEAWGEGLRGTLRSALDMAKKADISRGRVARSVGVAERTLETWIEHHGARAIPGDRLLRLIAAADGLPLEARRHLARTLVAGAGLMLMDEEGTNLDHSPLGVQLCEIGDAVGRIAKAAREVLDGNGDRAALANVLMEVEGGMSELGQLRHALKMKIGGEGTAGQRIDVIA